MDESTTIQAEQSKTTERYAVYDSPDGDEQQKMVGTYITEEVADQLGEYIEVEVSEGEGEGLSLTSDKETASFVVFSSEADAVEATYISNEVLESIGADADSTLDVLARSSSEEAFNDALEAQTISEDETEQEADALLAGDDSESEEAEADDSEEADDEPSAEEQEADALVAGADGSTETEADDSDENDDEEVKVSDDELGI
jgi:hypothetical protein